MIDLSGNFLVFSSVGLSPMNEPDWWTIVGTLASLTGLGLGLYVLRVAKDARRAAREARVLARKRNLAEELEQARNNIEVIGDYLTKKEWMAVRIRAQEIMTRCRESLTRWPDGLSENRKNDVRNVSSLVHSLADEAAAFSTRFNGAGTHPP